MPRLIAMWLVALVGSIGAAQETPGWKAADLNAPREAYLKERAAAVEAKFSPEILARLDALVERSKKYAARGLFTEAARSLREARWQLPYQPADQPEHLQRVFGNPRMRHGEAISSVALNPRGEMAVVGSRDGSVKVWELGNGRELRTLRGIKEAVTVVAWSGDGKYLAAAGGSDIIVWDATSFEKVQTFTGHTGRINTISFRPDGKWLASAGDDKSLKVWDVSTGKPAENVKLPVQTSAIFQVAFSPNGKLLASVNNEGFINAWIVEPKEGQRHLALGDTAHSGGAFLLAWAADGKSIFTSGNDMKLHQYGAPGPDGENVAGRGVRMRTIDLSTAGYSKPLIGMAVQGNGETIFTIGHDKFIRAWDSNNRLARLFSGHTDEVTALALASDGKIFVSGSADQTVRVVEVALSDPRRVFDEHKGYVWSVVNSKSGKLLASAGVDRVINIRDLTTDKIIARLEGHTAPITALAFSPDETMLASGGGDRVVKIWELASKTVKRELTGHNSAIICLAWSNDGKTILTGSADRTARLWNAENGTLIHEFKDFRTTITAVAFRADDKRAAVGGADGSLRVIELSGTPKVLSSTTGHVSGVSALVWLPEDRLATCGGDQLVKLWKVQQTGVSTFLAELRGHIGPVSALAASSDGRLLVSGGADTNIKVWNIATKQEILSLRGHSDWIGSLAFAADGQSIFSGSVDKTVSQWDMPEEQSASASLGHTLGINTIAISRDGKYLATGSSDMTIRIWDASTGGEIAILTGPTDKVTALSFDLTGEKLYVGGDDRKLRLYDWRKGKELSSVTAERIPGLMLSTSGENLLAWYYRAVKVEPPFSAAVLLNRELAVESRIEEKEKKASCMAFSPDGAWVAIGSQDGKVRLWDIANKERVYPGDLAAHVDGVADLAITPDKTRLITSSEKAEIKVWNATKRGEALKTFKAHDDLLAGMVLSPDGTRLATFTTTGEVKVWNLAKGELLRTWKLPTTSRNLAFSPDGATLYTANGDTTVYALEMPAK